MFEYISGYRTHLISAATVAFGIIGLLLGQLDSETAMQFILNGLGLSALRAGVKKAEK